MIYWFSTQSYKGKCDLFNKYKTTAKWIKECGGIAGTAA
jgi:hypothetical protein